MCGRFSLYRLEGIIERFRVKKTTFQIIPSYNIAPSHEIFAIDSNNQLIKLKWGLIPFWTKERTLKKTIINARAESVDKKPVFKNSFKYKRCLIPADGFYEWKAEGKRKVPYRISLKNNELFGFAGLWDSWKAPSGKVINTCAIITTAANSLVKPIHNRMPVILPREAENIWLNPSLTDSQVLNNLLIPYPAELMKAYKISDLVNSPSNNTPKIVEAIAESYFSC